MVQEPKPFIANLQPKMFRSNLTYRYINIYIYMYIYIYIHIYIYYKSLQKTQVSTVSVQGLPGLPSSYWNTQSREIVVSTPRKKKISLKNPHPISMLELLNMKNSAKPLSQYISMFFPSIKTTNKKPSSTVVKCDSLVDQPLWSTMNLLWTTYVPLLTTYFPRF